MSRSMTLPSKAPVPMQPQDDDFFLAESVVWPPTLRQQQIKEWRSQANYDPNEDPTPIRHLDQLEVYDDHSRDLVDVAMLSKGVLMARGWVWNRPNSRNPREVRDLQRMHTAYRRLEWIPVTVGPLTEYSLGFGDSGNQATLYLHTEDAYYQIQRPSKRYEYVWNRVQERCDMSQVIFDFLLNHNNKHSWNEVVQHLCKTMHWLPDYALTSLKRYARFIEKQCQQQPPRILKSEFYKQLQSFAKTAAPVGVYDGGCVDFSRNLQKPASGLPVASIEEGVLMVEESKPRVTLDIPEWPEDYQRVCSISAWRDWYDGHFICPFCFHEMHNWRTSYETKQQFWLAILDHLQMHREQVYDKSCVMSVKESFRWCERTQKYVGILENQGKSKNNAAVTIANEYRSMEGQTVRVPAWPENDSLPTLNPITTMPSSMVSSAISSRNQPEQIMRRDVLSEITDREQEQMAQVDGSFMKRLQSQIGSAWNFPLEQEHGAENVPPENCVRPFYVSEEAWDDLQKKKNSVTMQVRMSSWWRRVVRS